MFQSTRQIIQLLRWMHEDLHRVIRQNEDIMSKATEAVDRIIGIAHDLIASSKTLSEALRASNLRADALAAELAEFKANDAADDQAQLTAQDESIAVDTDRKAAALAAEIAAINGGNDAAQAEGDAAAEEAAAEAEPAAPADGASASEDAHVVVVDEELGAGDPAVETPHADDEV